MTAIEKAVLDQFKALVRTRSRLHQMFVFGSRARGDADPDSDLDVVVILEDPVTQESRNLVSECAWEAGFDHAIVIVPVVFSRDEWENGPERSSLLALAVEREGIAV
jgi:predicted nucleotidyltransferase